MSTNEYGHDFDDPESHLNALEVALLDVRSTVTRCPHCTTTARMLPMTGTGWGLEVFHEPDCPEHEDNQPACEPTRPDEDG